MFTYNTKYNIKGSNYLFLFLSGTSGWIQCTVSYNLFTRGCTGSDIKWMKQDKISNSGTQSLEEVTVLHENEIVK